MHEIAKQILETYVFEKKHPKVDELGLSDHEAAHSKLASFVTLMLDGEIVASSGRVHPKLDSTLEELIDNTIKATEDPRFEQHVANPEMARKLTYRVDLVIPEHRRLVPTPDEIDIKREGIIVLCQKQGRLGVILPGMMPSVKNGDDFYQHALAKSGISTTGLKRGDILVYAIKTKAFH